MTSHRERRLIRKCKAGDAQAFGVLTREHLDAILALAYDLTGNYEEAKDLAQEAFIRAFEKIDQFQETARFSTWVYRITTNLALDGHRKKRRAPKQISIDADHARYARTLAAPETSDRQATQSAANKATMVALDLLSANQRTAIVLKYFHQKSSREIGEMMGCSDTTVRIHVFRGLRNLRTHLGREIRELLQ